MKKFSIVNQNCFKSFFKSLFLSEYITNVIIFLLSLKKLNILYIRNQYFQSRN